MKIKQPFVVAFGGGVNSTAMLVGMKEREITPDLILFADTGGEKPETYGHVEYMREWAMREIEAPLVTVSASQKTDPTLEASCLRLGVLPSIVYGWKTCSQRWKLEPQDSFLNNWQPAKEAWEAGLRVTKAVGFDAGEPQRAKDFDSDKYSLRYFLIEWNWSRAECVDAILRAGIPMPPKSACFFCPSSRKREVLQLKNEQPELYARAIAMERNAAPKLTDIKGLGRRWSWEDLGRADENQGDLFTETVSVPCGCFDGED